MTTVRPSPSPRPKQNISLEDWDKKAPLNDAQQRSIALLQRACEDKSLPIKVEDEPVSRASTPAQRSRFPAVASPTTSSRPGTPNLGQPSQTQHHLLPKSAIQTPQQFFDWFATIEHQATHSREAHFRAHLADVAQHIETCDHLLRSVDDVQVDVVDMLERWRGVEANGKRLKESSEMLLGERDRLIDLSEEISARLEYFRELEHATRMLNHPGDSLVLQADFLDMVERVDVCIEFLRAHPQYHEAEIYLLRFQQCLTRAMTLIKMYFVGLFKALVSDIISRVSDKNPSRTALTHLLYTRFHSVSSTVAPLLGELERRAQAHPEQLSSLLAECHGAYFAARRTLLVGVGKVVEEIRGLDPGRADLVELTRSGCSYMKQLCLDEFTLYKCFFNSGKELLYRFLETLCDYLYDDLRPRILHEARLSVLCEVCKVLQALMVLDSAVGIGLSENDSAIADSDDDENGLEINFANGPVGSSSQTNTNSDSSGLHKLHLRHLLQSVLQDAQTRLFFKAQAVVQAEIGHYVPRPADLEYPEVLVRSSSEANSRSPIAPVLQDPPSIVSDPSSSALFTFSTSKFAHHSSSPWYPPLKTTISVLEQMHDFVQPAIFEDIAKEAIDLCRTSLGTAKVLIGQRVQGKEKEGNEARKGEEDEEDELSPDPMDADLFLIRHLLVLKQMVNDLNFGDSWDGEQGGFGPGPVGGRGGLGLDFFRPSVMLPSAFASSLGRLGGDLSVNSTGVKENIDEDLRQACERVIAHATLTCTQPLSAFLTPTTSPPQHHSYDNKSKPQSPPVTAPRIPHSLAMFPSHLASTLPIHARRFRLYFSTINISSTTKGDGENEDRTAALLSMHVKDRVAREYEEVWKRSVVVGEVTTGGKEEVLTPQELRIQMDMLCS